ncbi:hypothetical protein B0T16DRAFT_113491 [Cercophora newfieldiana]|uniref:Uncharacterized protein n=1 Tax=Cercophora newfieldiana TaxID=92897 RepID=A0AA39YAU5_9PEZI|nr:hypothetical protein B0T16DRAFT_113491 [Cercophora newfieldiana]
MAFYGWHFQNPISVVFSGSTCYLFASGSEALSRSAHRQCAHITDVTSFPPTYPHYSLLGIASRWYRTWEAFIALGLPVLKVVWKRIFRCPQRRTILPLLFAGCCTIPFAFGLFLAWLYDAL